MTAKQADKAVQAIAAKFEEEVSQGFRTDVSITFAEYAETVLEMKERNGLQPRTLVRYRSMLPRINAAIGHIALSKVRPQHLNELYKNLAEEGVRSGSERAVLIIDLELELNKRKLSKNKFAQITGLAPSTLRGAFNGNSVLVSTGMAIAKGLKTDSKKVFRTENNVRFYTDILRIPLFLGSGVIATGALSDPSAQVSHRITFVQEMKYVRPTILHGKTPLFKARRKVYSLRGIPSSRAHASVSCIF